MLKRTLKMSGILLALLIATFVLLAVVSYFGLSQAQEHHQALRPTSADCDSGGALRVEGGIVRTIA